MTTTELSQVWRVVWARIGQWEADRGDGSARPVFEEEWAAATRTVGVRGTPRELEAAWSAWLRAGQRLTRERAAIAEAQTRAKDGQLFAGSMLRRPLPQLVHREPGEDDDVP